MPYQNNNHRHTPEAAEYRQIKPAATVTDKRIRYAPDYSKSTKWANTASLLVSLGKGLMNFEVLEHYWAQENVIAAQFKTEMEGGNKQEWADVSKRIKGMAVLNPYNDDAFRRIQAMDIFKAAALKVQSTPELEKMDEQAYYKLVNDEAHQMYEGFRQTGLTPKDYAPAVKQWNNSIVDLTNKYLIANRQYKYNILKPKETSDLAFDIEAKMLEAPDDANRTLLLKQCLEDRIAHLTNDTGIQAPDEQAEIVMGALEGYISRNLDLLTDEEFLAAIADIKMGNGQSMHDVVPFYDAKIENLLTMARRQRRQQLEEQMKLQDKENEQNEKNAFTDYMTWLRENPNPSPGEHQKYVNELINKHNLQNSGSAISDLLADIHKGAKNYLELLEIKTNPETEADLTMKVTTGEAPYNEIAQAVADYKLNPKDALSMYNYIDKDLQKQKTELDKRVSELEKRSRTKMIYGTHTGDSDIQGILANDTELQTLYNNGLIDLRAAYEKTKEKDPAGAYKKYNDDLYELTETMRKYVEIQNKTQEMEGFIKGYEMLASTPKLTQAQLNRINFQKDTQAFRKMGIVKSGGQIDIASMPSASRTIKVNGKTITSRHDGYDLSGIKMGKPVYIPGGKGGTVVGVVKEAHSGGYGNMVIVKCDNGKYVRIAHLQYAGLPYVGQKIDANTPIGYKGNTGRVENKKAGSLHMEFFDRDAKQWIPAHEFLEN